MGRCRGEATGFSEQTHPSVGVKAVNKGEGDRTAKVLGHASGRLRGG